MIKKGFYVLLAFSAMSIVINLLNKWRPQLGLGDVLYYVAAGLVAYHFIEVRPRLKK